jgi:hypothetical protein
MIFPTGICVAHAPSSRGENLTIPPAPNARSIPAQATGLGQGPGSVIRAEGPRHNPAQLFRIRPRPRPLPATSNAGLCSWVPSVVRTMNRAVGAHTVWDALTWAAGPGWHELGRWPTSIGVQPIHERRFYGLWGLRSKFSMAEFARMYPDNGVRRRGRAMRDSGCAKREPGGLRSGRLRPLGPDLRQPRTFWQSAAGPGSLASGDRC